eukprot:580381-Heterocapsa_arctica.AAC.1
MTVARGPSTVPSAAARRASPEAGRDGSGSGEGRRAQPQGRAASLPQADQAASVLNESRAS